MEGKNKDVSFLKIVRTIEPMIFKSCPAFTIVAILTTILHSLTYVGNTFMTQKFFDSITAASSGKVGLKIVYFMLGGLCVSLVLTQVLNGVSNFLCMTLNDKVKGSIGKILNNKSSKLNAIDFENPLLLDDINKAQKGLESGGWMFIILITIVTFYIPYFLFLLY